MTSTIRDIYPISESKDNIVLEQREKIVGITNYIESTLSQLETVKYVVEEEFYADEAMEILNEDLPDGPVPEDKNLFITDIVRLCSLFWNRTTTARMTIWIEIVTTDMCRLFHVDNYRERLLCTYKGVGTEWLDHNNVNRKALGKGNNAAIVKDLLQIHQAKPFEVILIKGAQYGNGEQSVVHRSPQIEENNETRVLLKIYE